MSVKLSPSTLKLMEECPRCFWLHFNKKIKRPEMGFPTLPRGMDNILKEHFDRFMKKGELPPELKEHKVEGKLFDDEGLLKVWRNPLRGISWEDGRGNVLRGAVDNILMKGKRLIVLDYKTRGFALKEDTAAHYQHQLNLYNFLLRKNGYPTEDYAYLLFYVPALVLPSGEMVFETELVKMKVSVEDAEKMFKKALKILEGEIPPASEECKYCRYVEERK